MLRARGFPRTKPILPFGRSRRPYYQTKRSQWHDRGDGSRKQARSPPNRFRQTNPLTRYDVLSSEKCRCSGQGAFPERSQFSPSDEADDRITKRSQWHDRGDGSRKQARSPPNRFPQTNPLTRYDVLSSEKCRYSGRGAFPERSQSEFVGGRFPERSQYQF
jgi:hypothetical protein